MSIEAQALTKIYGEQRALNSINVSIQSGEIVGFLGPNGAGKSTFMKILTGFIDPTYGSAQVAGYDVASESLEIRKRVGYLPEHNPLYLDMYVTEYLEFIGGLYKVSNLKNRINEVIGMVGLEKERHKKLGALSKGYRQRTGMAHSIIHNPDVLILDEPTTGLDPNQLDEIRRLIFNLGKEKTVMRSTHIMQEVEAICNKVIIINNGEIVADDKASLLVQKTEGIVIHVEFENEMDPVLFKSIEECLNVEKTGASSYQLGFAGKTDPRKAIFNLAVQHNNPLIGVQKETKNLEEVFKEFTS